jgi:small subunit ribosomal protein S10
MSQEKKIRIKLKAYDYKLLDSSAKNIASLVKETGCTLSGPLPLPVEIMRRDLLASPHVNKKARDQLEVRVHKRVIVITSTTPKTIDTLMAISLSAGVDVALKVDDA